MDKTNKDELGPNHKAAMNYMLKCKVIGVEIFKLELLANDEVELIDILDKVSTNNITIPHFITKFRLKYSIDNQVVGPFNHCKFKSITINNQTGRDLNARYLFCGLKSSEVTIKFLHSECIINMYNMFAMCYSIHKIDLSSLNTKNVRNMSGMFEECKNLEYLDLSNFDLSNTKETSRMFKGAQSCPV